MSPPVSSPAGPRLVLASSSAYRRALLDRLGLAYAWRAPAVDETPRDGEEAVALALRLAIDKARALASRYPRHLVIGSDQTATLGAELLGKPGSFDAAASQLARASGRTLVFHTAVAVLDTLSGRLDHESVPTTVAFRQLDARRIRSYLAREPALDCAGSFKSEALGAALCERIESADPTALVGLPLLSVVRLLARHGCEVLDPLTSPS